MNIIDLIIIPDKEDEGAADIYVKGYLDSKEYSFILDTGAATSGIQHDEHTANYKIVSEHNSSGIFAQINGDMIIIPEFRIGSLMKRDFMISRKRRTQMGIRNEIGMDVLKSFCCLFQFKHNRLKIGSPEEFNSNKPEYNQYDLILGEKFHPYIGVQLEGYDIKTVWDSGAGITVVDQKVITSHPACFREIGVSIGTDASGTQFATPMYEMKSLKIGNYTFQPHKVAGVDLHHVNTQADIPMQMIIGYSTFSQAEWFFDFVHKKWAITCKY